jgi:hypothetical protein
MLLQIKVGASAEIPNAEVVGSKDDLWAFNEFMCYNVSNLSRLVNARNLTQLSLSVALVFNLV